MGKVSKLLFAAAVVALVLVCASSTLFAASVAISGKADIEPALVIRNENPQPTDSAAPLTSPTLTESTVVWYAGRQWIVIGWDGYHTLRTRANSFIGGARYTGSYHPDSVAGVSVTGDYVWALSTAEASLLHPTIQSNAEIQASLPYANKDYKYKFFIWGAKFAPLTAITSIDDL